MNDGLDSSLVLPGAGEKPSKQYRTSPYTVREYAALPYYLRCAVDATCNEQEGITYTTHDDLASEKPYTVGRRQTTSLSTGIEAPYQSTNTQPTSLNPAMLIETAPAIAQTAPEVEEVASAPSKQSAALSRPQSGYDLVAVVSRYIALVPTDNDEHWTHCGPSPFLRGDTHSLAVNGETGTYQCYATNKWGRALDFVMFMEECSQEEALDWLDALFPIDLTAAEVVHENGVLPAAPVAEEVADGPACAYPGFAFGPSAAPAAIVSDPSPKGEGSAPDFAQLAQAVSVIATPPAEADSPKAIDGTIYQTTNYDLFHLLPENRHIDPRQVGKLVREIKVKNMLHIKPMDVTADMGIIDGQHRREAARELGVPIFYRIGEKLSGDDIRSLNVASKNWVGTDYLHHWTVLGKPDYQALTDFMKRYPILSFSNAVLLLQDSDTLLAPQFRDGLWTASLDPATATETAEFIQRIAADVPSFKQAKSSRFISSVLYCIKSVEGFSSERFLKKILLAPTKLVPCGNRKQYLLLFGDIYNFGATKEQRITFS